MSLTAMSLTVDPPLFLAFAATWAAGLGTLQLLRIMFATRRDRTVDYLSRQLAEAERQIIALKAQVDILERLGFRSIHDDHAEILRRLPAGPPA